MNQTPTFHRNRNQLGRVAAVQFGLAELVDALVRIFTLGWFCTRLPLDCSREQARRMFAKQRELNDPFLQRLVPEDTRKKPR